MSTAAVLGWASVGWAALGGGAGAALRYAVNLAVAARWRGRFPLGTLLVNVTGSLLLGILMRVLGGVADPTSAQLAVVLGAGVLGGYTTFSTAIVESVLLARTGHRRTALAYAVGTMVATVAAAGVGLALGGLMR